MDQVAKIAEININVGLDAQNVPVKIDWRANDNPQGADFQECKAMLLAFFDKENRETMKIDLWTTEMQVIEMDRFFYQTLRAMTDTYFKATKNKQLANDMQRFVQYFGEQTEILKK